MVATTNKHRDRRVWSSHLGKLSAFIVDLVRAANAVECLSEERKLRLLGRAYVTILQAREEIDASSAVAYEQAGVDLIRATGHVTTLSDFEVKALLLDAAEMIRQINIVLESKGPERSS